MNTSHIELAAQASEDVFVYNLIINGVDCGYTAGGVNTPEQMAAIMEIVVNNLTIPNVVASAYQDRVIIKAVDDTATLSVSCGGKLSVAIIYSPIPCSAIENGATIILAGTVTDIVTPVSGLVAVENLQDGLTGRDEETDTQLRQRIIAIPAVGGRSTEAAIKARLINELPGVIQAAVISNRNLETDGDGRPGKSFEVIIQTAGGDDDAIAQKIWDNAPAGIKIVSTSLSPSSGIAIDSNGNQVAVAFSRPTNKDVWLWVDLTYDTEEEFPADGFDQIKAALVKLGSLATLGGDIIVQRFYGAIYSVRGIATATIYMAVSDTTPSKPVDPATNYSIAPSEIAAYDPDRIVVENA